MAANVERFKPFVVFLSVFMLMALAACSTPEQQQLESRVRQASSKCPIDAGAGFTIESVTYHHGVVTYNASVDSRLVRLDVLKPKAHLIAPALTALVARSDNPVLNSDIEMCRMARAKVKFVITDGKETLTVDFDPADVTTTNMQNQ